MLISKYSAPDFNPYEDESNDDTDKPWDAPRATGPIDALVTLPGSKSQTARELVLSALADGSSTLRGALASRDTTAMVGALTAFGATVEEQEAAHGDPDLTIAPAEELVGSTTIDCAQAGTVMRFVPPLAALGLGPTVFDADDSARHRPMAALIEALRALGADINDDGHGTLPFTVHGMGRLAGGTVELDSSDSSQFVSALLLAGARFDEGVEIVHTGQRLPSLPHIEMTLAALTRRGVDARRTDTARWTVAPGPIAAAEVDIEPDLSNAAPFLAAAVVTGGTVTIPSWPEQTTQVGATLSEILPQFGARVERDGDRLTVTGPERIRGVELDLSAGGELATIVAALAALADEPSRITGIGHIRHHETDRLAGLAAEITALGGAATELHDGLLIEPAELHGGLWHSYHDHRMATAGAVLGLAVEGVQVENIATTAKTMPTFTVLWERMLGGAGVS